MVGEILFNTMNLSSIPNVNLSPELKTAIKPNNEKRHEKGKHQALKNDSYTCKIDAQWRAQLNFFGHFNYRPTKVPAVLVFGK